MRYLIDIDSALVSIGRRGRRHSIPDAIKRAKALMDKGHLLVVWSARGLRYCRRFVADNGLTGARAIHKPDRIVTRF